MEKSARNKVFDAIAWGVFIVLLGAGFILIPLNFARWTTGINVSKFSLFIGLLALSLSGAGIVGFAMPFIPTVIVLVGLFIVAEAMQKTLNKKPLQA